MAILINGKDMKDAVIKADQFEMRVTDLTPDHLKANVKDTSGQPFNFVPRFISMVYPDKTIDAKDTGIIVVGAGRAIDATIQFQEKLRIERFLTMDLRYARRRLASIVVE